MSYGYNDANHDHAVTHLGGVQKYWYDANGNQVTRIVGSDTYDLAYDAENRLVEVKKNNITIATFVYDGDGNRVKSTIGSLTTAFVGNHTEWEVGTSSLTRYYYAGSTRVVMRKNNTVYYLLGDHLGSTSVTTDQNGQNPAVQLYAPWGEVRYSSGSLQTRYTYTGQYSNVSDFGLMYYNARYYDPLLSRFTSADSIVPQPGNPQSWDRYSYVQNSPLNYTDPSGHMVAEPGSPRRRIDTFVISFQADKGVHWSENEKHTINNAGLEIGQKFANIINHDSFSDYKTGLLENRPGAISAIEAFLRVFGGMITFTKTCQTCAEYHMSLPNPAEDASSYNCWGRNMGGNNIYTFRNAPASGISEVFQWGVHEIFHAFDNLTGNSGRNFASNYDRAIFDVGRWQQSGQTENYEIFTDMGIAWTYSHWSRTSKDVFVTSTNMSEFMQINVQKLYYRP